MTARKIILSCLLLLFPFLMGSCATVGIEKAQYDVIEKKGKLEVRRYEPQIVAETVVEADFDDAGNVAFRRLFDYISGGNRSKESIKMTAPVNQEPDSEKISMTAPVNQQQDGDKYVVSFLMPGKYTMDTLPEPTDDDVRLRQSPARTVAAIRYSGTWSRDRYEAKKAVLQQWIEQQGLRVTGPDIFARYDPPFQVPIFRRNEVLLPVE